MFTNDWSQKGKNKGKGKHKRKGEKKGHGKKGNKKGTSSGEGSTGHRSNSGHRSKSGHKHKSGYRSKSGHKLGNRKPDPLLHGDHPTVLAAAAAQARLAQPPLKAGRAHSIPGKQSASQKAKAVSFGEAGVQSGSARKAAQARSNAPRRGMQLAHVGKQTTVETADFGRQDEETNTEDTTDTPGTTNTAETKDAAEGGAEPANKKDARTTGKSSKHHRHRHKSRRKQHHVKRSQSRKNPMVKSQSALRTMAKSVFCCRKVASASDELKARYRQSKWERRRGRALYKLRKKYFERVAVTISLLVYVIYVSKGDLVHHTRDCSKGDLVHHTC